MANLTLTLMLFLLPGVGEGRRGRGKGGEPEAATGTKGVKSDNQPQCWVRTACPNPTIQVSAVPVQVVP